MFLNGVVGLFSGGGGGEKVWVYFGGFCVLFMVGLLAVYCCVGDWMCSFGRGFRLKVSPSSIPCSKV